MKKKNAFTLIELISVLVILAIIALITTALVLNVIKRAKNSANKRSVDGYGKAIELSISDYLMHTGRYPISVDDLEIKYTGNNIECGIRRINPDGSVFLSVCKVVGVKVTDSKTDDGYYHYGKKILIDSDYIDFYGKAIEEAITKYKDINNQLPSDISDLEIDYSLKKVDCESKINEDGTVYLTNCSVEGIKVTDSKTDDGWYHYGMNENENNSYKLGDIVEYNGMKFYVIEDSDSSSNYVKLLKAELLTTDEIANLGDFDITDQDGIGTVSYGENSDYATSTIKQIIDAWSFTLDDSSDLKVDNSGYSARILNNDDLFINLGYRVTIKTSFWGVEIINAPSWINDVSCAYWGGNGFSENPLYTLSIGESSLGSASSVKEKNAVRPVINLLKSAIV